MQRFIVRSADLTDLPHIMSIQNSAYLPELREDSSVFECRLKIAPELNFLAETQGAVAGYVIAHLWPDRATPGLGRIIESIPAEADSIHIHDLAISSMFRGQGVARVLMQSLEDVARQRCHVITLVAVQGASGFWQHLGFEDDGPAQGYDQGARMMRRILV